MWIEEIIASSQFEGANTSRKAAKQLIERNRPPKNISEKMIVNNYLLNMKIQNEFKDQKLSKEVLLEMHALVTKGTLEDPAYEGAFRVDEGKEVPLHIDYDKLSDEKAIVFPSMDFVNGALDAFINFANDLDSANKFIHPVIKAIMIHFWFAYFAPI